MHVTVFLREHPPGHHCGHQIGFVDFHSVVSMETDTHLTFIGPIGEAIHHMLLLIGVGEAQRFAGHTRLVVDISVEHVGLARAAETDGANSLSQAVRSQASSLAARIEHKTPRKTEPIGGQHACMRKSQCILLHKLICCT